MSAKEENEANIAFTEVNNMVIDDDYQWDWHGNILTKEKRESLLSASDNETECPYCDNKIKGHLWGRCLCVVYRLELSELRN